MGAVVPALGDVEGIVSELSTPVLEPRRLIYIGACLSHRI